MASTPAEVPGARRGERERIAVWLIAAASAAGAALAQVHPTAAAGSDLVLALGFGAGVAAAGAAAGPRARLLAAVVAGAGLGGPWGLAALLTVGAATVAVRGRRLERDPVVGALVGAAVVQVVLRLPTGRLGLDLAVSMLAVAPLLGSAWIHASHATRSRLRRASVVAGCFVGLAVVGLVVGVLLARHDVSVGTSRAQRGLAAARRGEGELAAQRLDAASRAFDAAHDDLDSWWARPARLLPVVGQHARSLQILAGAGAEVTEAAGASARQAGIEDLHVRDGGIDLDLVRSMGAPLDDVQVALRRARAIAPSADSEWLLPPVADGLQDFERSVDAAIDDAATASAAVAVLPDLLGADGRRTYLVAFGTPAESRELGGFMGAYGLLTATDGQLELAGTGRVRDLNELLGHEPLEDPSALPAHYVAMLPQRFWHNMPGVADFPTMAEAVDQQWPSAPASSLDGVIYMDPYTLADLLELTGPIRVEGLDEPLTAETAPDFLLRQQYIDFPGDDRHDFLVDAATTVFGDLTSGDLPRPARIADAVGPAIRERRLLLHSYRPEEQAVFERLELDGALPPVASDFLSVRASNRGLNKLDAMLQRTIDYDAVVDPVRGTVRSTVTVRLRNDAPASGLPEGVIGNRIGKPSGTNSTTVAVYTPLDLVDITRDGRSIGQGASVAHDRNRYIALVDVPAGEELTIVFELEGTVDVRHGYHLDVVPQPMVNPDRLRVSVEGEGSWRTSGEHEVDTELRSTVALDPRFAR